MIGISSKEITGIQLTSSNILEMIEANYRKSDV